MGDDCGGSIGGSMGEWSWKVCWDGSRGKHVRGKAEIRVSN